MASFAYTQSRDTMIKMDEGEMMELLTAIPDSCIVPMLIAVGRLKPGITLLPRAFRRRLDEFVSLNNYANRY